MRQNTRKKPMKLAKGICAILLVATLVGCKKTVGSEMSALLESGKYTDIILIEPDFKKQSKFPVQASKLATVLESLKGNEIEHPSTAAIYSFRLKINSNIETIEVFDGAIKIRDVYISLSEQAQMKMSALYRDTLYGVGSNAIERLKQEVAYGKFIDSILEIPMIQFEETFPAETMKQLFVVSQPTEPNKPTVPKYRYFFQPDTFVEISQSTLVVKTKSEEEFYSLTPEQFDLIDQEVQDMYYEKQIDDYTDFLGTDVVAPAFLSEELQQLYKQAYVISFGIYGHPIASGYLSDFTKNVEDSGHSYVRSMEKQFIYYHDFYQYASTLFTKEYLDRMLAEKKRYYNHKGLLYVAGFDGHPIYGYTGVSFERLKQTSNTIEFQVIGHYSPTEDKKEDDYITRYPTRLIYENGHWVFSELHIPTIGN